MYNTFECHFKPNKKKQREFGDPVGTCKDFAIVFAKLL